MNLVADEGVDRPIVERLRNDGHQVWYVAEMAPGIGDEEVLSLANNESALLMTSDKDFGELVYRQNLVHSGVILIRLEGLLLTTKAQIVSLSIKKHYKELTPSFSVITPGNIRIRSGR